MTLSPRARRIGLWTLAIIALAVLTWGRIRLIDNLRDQGWFTKYYELADRVLAGQVPVERIGDVSPLYLWSMVAMRAFDLGVNAIRDLQIIGVTIAALLCALAAKRLGGVVAAVASAVLILGNRAALVVATELEPETLILMLNAAAILAIVQWQRAPTARYVAIAGLLVGLSAIARPVALGIAVLVAAWILFGLRRVRAAAAFGAAAVAPLIAVAIVNWSLTGHAFIMQPGSQFYDANNPLATGAAGVLPGIVNDIQVTANEPDYLHVAYRIVAARATGGEIDPRLSNRYWSGKALAFIRTYPARAAELFGWKAILAVHNYDVYDLLSMKQKAMELSRYPAIPFGAIVVLAAIAFFVHRPTRELIQIALFAAALLFALVVFNVSARQRNAMLAPLAVLGGVAVGGIVRLARERSDRALIAFGALLVFTPALGIEGAPMRENDFGWRSSIRSAELRDRALRAFRAGDQAEARKLAAVAAIFNPDRQRAVPPELLRSTALALAAEAELPGVLFDAAVALETAGAWREAEAILRTIEHYRPLRENSAVSSVAWYRARAALHLGARREVVRELLDRAAREMPGDPHILALRSVTVDPGAAERLDALHDPFTRDFALALAFADAGQRDRADALLASLPERIPEWKRPAAVRHALRTATERSGSSGAGR